MKRGNLILLGLLGSLFVAGLVHLFNLRFEAGDVYPPYSTLRADPLGAKAFHDSLAELLEVRRNFSPFSRLGDGRQAALLYLGAASDEVRFTTNEFRDLETFVRTGGRLVIAFHPEYSPPRPNRFGPATPAPTGAPRPATNPPAIPPAPPARRVSRPGADPATISLEERWQVRLGHAPLERTMARGAFASAPARRRAGGAALPDEFAVHSALHFDQLGPDWRVIHARTGATNEWPVLIERTLGGGAIVLAADSYPFSNEALRRDRQTALLSWFLGGRSRVIFDETHLGTSSNPGLAALARRYRLHGLAAALVVLAALFIWRNAVSFLPPPPEELSAEAAHEVPGKDSTEGFVNLLRRHIAPVNLLKVCLEQWKQSATGHRQPARVRLEAMQQLIDEQNTLEPRRRQPVHTYQRFCDILSKRT